MRLTLRTMLAFLDDVLEGQDARELGQKIDESKFASDLVHRIRSSVRRLRLGAPKVDGKGMGADANTVAEYLDNTMPPEQFPEFEKVCLESDVHLAEVAACHQILTMVLGEPATVDPVIRDRMYRIGHGEVVGSSASGNGNGAAVVRPAAEAAASAAALQAVRAPTPSTSDHTAEPHHPTETEIQRAQLASAARSVNRPIDSGFPVKSLLLTVALGFIVAVVALRAIAPFNTRHPVWRLLAGSPTADISQAPEAPQADSAAAGTGQETTQATDSSEPAPQTPATVSSDSAASAADSSTSDASSPATTNPATPTTDSAEAAASVVGSTSTTTTAPMPATPMPATPTPAAPSSPATSEVTPMPAPGSTTVPPPEPAPPSSTPLVSPRPATQPTPAPAPVEPPAPVTVGRYISEEQILARLDPDKNSWMVLPPDTPLIADEPLLSLPTYRPQVLVAPSVKLTIAGEAFLRLHLPDATNVPQVTIDLGRAVLIPVGDMGNTVQIDFAGRRGQLIFADVESAVAVEVRPYLAPGSDPLMDPPSVVVQIWATSGGAEWRESGKMPVQLRAGQRGQFIDEAALEVVLDEAIPDWVEGKNLTDIERRASQELRKYLTTDRPLALSLMEHTNFRQVEVRALACRSLCYLDIFEPALAAMSDSQQKSYWHWQLAALQSALPFGAATVEKLRADIEKLHGDEANQVYRFLLGYSPQQLAEHGASDLVDALENPTLSIRVLALLTLQQITDKTLLFRPEVSPEQEKSKVIRWRKTLEDGQIVYKAPPSPLPPATSPTIDEAK